jgi:hypothetical protein
MVGLNTTNALGAIISALLYGLIFSLFAEFVTTIICALIIMISCLKTKNEHKYPGIRGNYYPDNFSEKPLAVSIVIIFSFGIAFLILSYVILDGNLRFYPLFAMLISYKASEHFLFSKARIAFIQCIFNFSIAFRKALVKIKNNAKKHLRFIKNGKNDYTPPLTK